MAHFRKVLMATDFSPASEPALSEAIDLVKATGGELTLLHVIELPSAVGPEPFSAPGTFEAIEANARAAVQPRMAEAMERARAEGVPIESAIAFGHPADVICRETDARRPDLLVMGTEGRGALAKIFLGSVAAKVIPHANCPVLTVRHRR